LIIFGTRRSVTQLALVVLTCVNCHRSAAHAVLKAVTKFTLFFIPLFPVRTRYAHQCTACGFLLWIEKQQAEALTSAPPAGAPQQMPPQQQMPQQPWPGPAPQQQWGPPSPNGNGHAAPGQHPGARG
jgi:hypothetical protein